jgi:hypothetical protein
MRSISFITNMLVLYSFSVACGTSTFESKSKNAPSDFAMSEFNYLSETGLYQNIATGDLAANIRQYTPRFELYADAAQKRRYIFFPPGSQIIPTNLELWQYPSGTKIWKEFFISSAGAEKKIETRLLEKVGNDWEVATFIWGEDQTDAARWGGQNGTVPIDIQLDETTRYTVPSYSQCILCHNQRSQSSDELHAEPVLGFTSFQLSREYISELVLSDNLREPSIPWQRHRTYAVSTPERDVFGYMHANCGHCHNQRRTDMIPGVGNPTFTLNYNLDTHTSRASTHVIKQIGKPVAGQGDPEFPSDAKLLVPASVSKSMIYLRMNTLSIRHRMPLLGIANSDQQFINSRLKPWIQGLSN